MKTVILSVAAATLAVSGPAMLAHGDQNRPVAMTKRTVYAWFPKDFGNFDTQAIADLIDGLCIMSYCMSPPTAGWTGGAQPVQGGGKVTGHARDYVTCIKDYLEATGGRKDKLLLGVSNDLGGTEWTCRTDRPLSPIIGRPRKLTAQEARANAEKHGPKFAPQQKVPWYVYHKDGQWAQGWYEDEQSLAAKLELAKEQRLPGVCVWVLDGANEPPSTLGLLRNYLRGE